MKIAIITGASSGMGAEFVSQIDRGCNDLDQIWAISRTVDETEFPQTKAEIIRSPLNLTKKEAKSVLAEKLKNEMPKVKILVNSAGFGKMGKFESLSLELQTDKIGRAHV